MITLDMQALRLNYSLRRLYVDDFMQRQAAQLQPGTYVLDLGGHKMVKRGRFDMNRYPVKTVCLNIVTEKATDIQGDGAALPLASNSFDAVICTEVLEHVPDPRLLVAESCRVLRPGGKLIATVPFLYQMHADPYDFGRYTHHYWRVVLQEAGFDTIDIERQGYYFSVLLDFVKSMISRLGGSTLYGYLIRRCLAFVVLPLQLGVRKVEAHPRVAASPFFASFTTGFGFVATKR